MPDYIAITDTQIEPEAPVTSELMNQLRDNPLAIAEGADSAPRVQSEGLSPTFAVAVNVGYSTSLEWGGAAGMFSIQGSSGSSSEVVTLRYRTSTDGGTTTTSWSTIATADIGTSGRNVHINPFQITFPVNTNWVEFDAQNDVNVYEQSIMALLYGA